MVLVPHAKQTDLVLESVPHKVKRAGIVPPIQIETVPIPSTLRGFRALNANRAGFLYYYADILRQEPRFKGRVLDVGCGPTGPTAPAADGSNLFGPILRQATQVDGVEPGGGTEAHPYLTQRWHSTLEDADVPANTYDAMIAFNVLEHVATPNVFLSKVAGALKPGGVFYASTPHSNHPFSLCVRLIQALGLKQHIADSEYDGKIQRIPTYYRLNSKRSVVATARQLGFSRARFYFAPSVNWDSYFPARLRFVPNFYDRIIGATLPGAAQQMMVMLEKAVP